MLLGFKEPAKVINAYMSFCLGRQVLIQPTCRLNAVDETTHLKVNTLISYNAQLVIIFCPSLSLTDSQHSFSYITSMLVSISKTQKPSENVVHHRRHGLARRPLCYLEPWNAQADMGRRSGRGSTADSAHILSPVQ